MTTPAAILYTLTDEDIMERATRIVETAKLRLTLPEAVAIVLASLGKKGV